MAESELPRRLGRFVYVYAAHTALLLFTIAAYLFYGRPELLDWWTWISALAVAGWSLYNLPFTGRVLGHKAVLAYRRACIRRFTLFKVLSGVILLPCLVWGALMIRELWARFEYVDLVKQLVGTDSKSLPTLPDPRRLGRAYNAFPHRREVPFIVSRMSRVLSFDDELGNFNRFMDSFLQSIDRERVIERYANPASLAPYADAVDPIIYLSRLLVESENESVESLHAADELLAKYRAQDSSALAHRLIYRHEWLEQELAHQEAASSAAAGSKLTTADVKPLRDLSSEIDALLQAIKSYSAENNLRLVTADVFQELLDHSAQIHVTLAAHQVPGSSAEKVVAMYTRILTVRRRIVNELDAPWLNGPGKLTLFHFFKYCAGRETFITRDLVKRLRTVPGLVDLLRARTYDADAFKAFRDLEAWEQGTPLDRHFAGSGTREKVTSLLEEGW